MIFEKDFVFCFSKGSRNYKLTSSIPIPLALKSKEYAFRLVTAHNLPSHIEDDLCDALQAFLEEQTDEYHLEKVKDVINPVISDQVDVDKLSNVWSKRFQEEHAIYSKPEDISNEAVLSEVYHKLVHSPGVENLLSMEHSFALVMENMVLERDQEIRALEEKQQEEMERAISNIGISTSDVMVNALAVQQFEDSQMLESKWESEIGALRQSQKREYIDWLVRIHEEYETTGNIDILNQQMAGDRITTGDWPPQSLPMEESFTIHLGTQLKQMHNVRLLSANILDLCRYKQNALGVDPKRFQTAMSLYSNNLCGLVSLVDNRISRYSGIKKEFAGVCQRSTEFHFQELDDQLEAIRNEAEQVVSWRLANTKSLDFSSNYSPVRTTTSSTEVQSPHSTNLQPGDFYVTRHSNISGMHVVFHVVTDDSLRSGDISSRHPVILGLRNVLKMMCMFDISVITLPLFLVLEMSEEMTISWCMKRAELVYKCIKGFMIEMASWGGVENRTVEFLIPKGISEDLFSSLSSLLPSIFRVSNPLVVKS